MSTKKYIILFLHVLVICVFAGSTVAANTVIPYSLNSGWAYEADYPETLELTANPSGGIIVSIDIPTGIDNGGLVASRHDLSDYSLHDCGFIQLEYSSFSSEITGNSDDVGPNLCLEIEFYDADDVMYEMAIEVSQDHEGFYFETWFGSYYKIPVPDGLSVAEGALGLYSDGYSVRPYFIDAAGSLFYLFDPWDVSGITGTHDYSVDNDFEGTPTVDETITASVNLEQVVYGLGGGGGGGGGLDIDWIGMTSMKQFRDGVPQGDYPWSLDIWVRVVDPGTLDHIDITKPGDSSPFVTMYEEGASGWWEFPLDSDYASLSALRADYPEGTYKFDFRDSGGVLIKSLEIAYSGLPGEPTEPVEFLYPSANGQTGISVNPTFTWSVSPDAADTLLLCVDNDEVVYLDAPVSINSTSWTPGSLLPSHEFELDVSVMNIKDWAGGPGFPTTTDQTGDTFSYSYMVEYLNEIAFTTGQAPAISATLDIVDDTITTKAKWITCNLRLPPENSVTDIDLDSIRLGGGISPVSVSVRTKQQMLVAKFAASDLNLAPSPDPYLLTVSGQLVGGSSFSGSDEITVVEKGGKPS